MFCDLPCCRRYVPHCPPVLKPCLSSCPVYRYKAVTIVVTGDTCGVICLWVAKCTNSKPCNQRLELVQAKMEELKPQRKLQKIGQLRELRRVMLVLVMMLYLNPSMSIMFFHKSSRKNSSAESLCNLHRLLRSGVLLTRYGTKLPRDGVNFKMYFFHSSRSPLMQKSAPPISIQTSRRLTVFVTKPVTTTNSVHQCIYIYISIIYISYIYHIYVYIINIS